MARMKEKMETEEGQAIYCKRGPVAEFPNAWFKAKFNFRQTLPASKLMMLAGPSSPTTWPSGRVCVGDLDLQRNFNHYIYIRSQYLIIEDRSCGERGTAPEKHCRAAIELQLVETGTGGMFPPLLLSPFFRLVGYGMSPLAPACRSEICLKRKNSHLLTVSTRVENWMQALRTDLKDGYIARYHDGEFRIVADGFGFTNEIRFDAKEEHLYVVETTGGCITRLRIDDAGDLSDREVFGPTSLGKGAWPDGIAFDSYGNLWGTMVYSDKLFVLTPEGDLRILLDEGDSEKVDALERQFFLTRYLRRFCSRPAQALRHGWRALHSAARICVRRILVRSKASVFPIFGLPVAGLPMVHWND